MTEQRPLGPDTMPGTIGEVLEPALETAPEREAIVSTEGRVTYRELEAEIQAAVGVLHALGVRAGDRVAATLPNSHGIVAAFHATARLGAIWVGINRLLSRAEKEFILGDAGCRVYVVDSETAEQMRTSSAVAGPGGARLVCRGGPADLDDWEALLGSEHPVPPRPVVKPTDPVGIAYTSGTTGFPKGVVHSHRNLIVASRCQAQSRGYGPDLRKADLLALTILNVMTATSLLIEQVGGTSILLPSARAVEVARTIREESATCFQGVPPVLYSMVADEAVTRDDLASLTEVLTGGAATPEVLHDRFRQKFGLSIVGTYGLTEAPIMVSMDDRDGDGHRRGASGRTLPHVEVFAADDDGRGLPPGEVGELCVRASSSGEWAGVYTPMLGYWNRPDATAEVVRDGALQTGDVGYVDADGYVFVVDRKKAMIIRGGANVYPAEVERVLVAQPGVADCAVFGIPDDRLGERVAALVQLADGAAVTGEELRARCGEQLARYKVPDLVRFVDEFPRNSMNKIIRKDLGRVLDQAVRNAADEGA